MHRRDLSTRKRPRPKLKWRTRDSQNSQLYNLQLDINDLRQQIQSLAQEKSLLILSQQRLNRSDDPDGSLVKIVAEYFRVFYNGLVRSSQPVVAARGHQVDPLAFVRQVMDDHVSIGRYASRQMMLDQWMRYSAALAPVKLTFLSAHVVPTNMQDADSPYVMVTSKASYEAVFSVETVALMFPHLSGRDDVVRRLLGRVFKGTAVFDFVFDRRTRQVVVHDFRLDLLAAFTPLLRDPRELAVLFSHATISEEYLIGDINVYAPYANDPVPQAARAAVSPPRQPMNPTFVELMDQDNNNRSPPQTQQPWQLQMTHMLTPEHVMEIQDQEIAPPKSRSWQFNVANLLSSDDDEDAVPETDASAAVDKTSQYQQHSLSTADPEQLHALSWS